MIQESALYRPEHRQGLSKLLRSPSKLTLIGLNLVVYYFLLRWVEANIQSEKLVDHLGQIPVWAVMGTLAINLAALALYGVRMALLLGKGFPIGFSIINIGYTLNTLIPMRLGEPVKIYLSHRLYGTPLLEIFSASVAEKLLDLFKVLMLGLIVMAFVTSELIQTSALFPVIALIVLGMVAYILFRLHIVRIVKILPKKSRLRRISIELHKHSGNYPVRRVLAVSLGIWILNVAVVFFTFNTYLPGIHISILDAAALLLILILAIAIPSAPAGIGLLEAGIIAFLTQKSGVGNEAALAAAAAFHLVIALPQVLITSWLLWSRLSKH